MASEGNMTSLEEKLTNLEELTKKLEQGNLPIDEAIALYSQGMELAVSCKKSLDEMSLNGKITVGVKPHNDRWGLSQVDNFSIGIFLAVEPEMGI